MMPHLLHQQELITTVSTINHSNVSANLPVLKLTECASWCVANGLHVPPVAYKLHSLSDLIYNYPATAGEDQLQPRDRLIG